MVAVGCESEKSQWLGANRDPLASWPMQEPPNHLRFNMKVVDVLVLAMLPRHTPWTSMDYGEKWKNIVLSVLSSCSLKAGVC